MLLARLLRPHHGVDLRDPAHRHTDSQLIRSSTPFTIHNAWSLLLERQGEQVKGMVPERRPGSGERAAGVQTQHTRLPNITPSTTNSSGQRWHTGRMALIFDLALVYCDHGT